MMVGNIKVNGKMGKCKDKENIHKINYLIKGILKMVVIMDMEFCRNKENMYIRAIF